MAGGAWAAERLAWEMKCRGEAAVGGGAPVCVDAERPSSLLAPRGTRSRNSSGNTATAGAATLHFPGGWSRGSRVCIFLVLLPTPLPCARPLSPSRLPAQASGISLTSPCTPRPSPLQLGEGFKVAPASAPPGLCSSGHVCLPQSGTPGWTPKAEPAPVPWAPRARLF